MTPSPVTAAPGPVPPVHPALRPYLSSLTGYHDQLAPNAVHHGLPSPALTVVFSFDEPLDCGWLTGADQARYWTCVSGLHTEPAVIRTHGEQHGIQLGLTPLGARALLGMPSAALAGVITEGSGLPSDLHARLAESGSWWDRFELVQQVLLRMIDRYGDACSAQVVPEVSQAWRRLRRTGGRVPIGVLAGELGWGRRRLLSEFRAEYGIGPKQAAQIVRFDRAQRLSADGRDLAEVAAVCGFADQAHMTREFARLAARTPRQLRANAYFT